LGITNSAPSSHNLINLLIIDSVINQNFSGSVHKKYSLFHIFIAYFNAALLFSHNEEYDSSLLNLMDLKSDILLKKFELEESSISTMSIHKSSQFFNNLKNSGYLIFQISSLSYFVVVKMQILSNLFHIKKQLILQIAFYFSSRKLFYILSIVVFFIKIECPN
jgi:hypothetical protein